MFVIDGTAPDRKYHGLWTDFIETNIHLCCVKTFRGKSFIKSKDISTNNQKILSFSTDIQKGKKVLISVRPYFFRQLPPNVTTICQLSVNLPSISSNFDASVLY